MHPSACIANTCIHLNLCTREGSCEHTLPTRITHMPTLYCVLSYMHTITHWFWLRGWLIYKGAICTGTAPLFWNFISLFERPQTRFKRKISSQDQSTIHAFVWIYVWGRGVVNIPSQLGARRQRKKIRRLPWCTCSLLYVWHDSFRIVAKCIHVTTVDFRESHPDTQLQVSCRKWATNHRALL